MIKPDAQHPDHIEYLPVWQKCRDAAAGQRAIKAGRALYLKPLAGQELKASSTPGLISEYDAYLDRANYFNATGRTVDAMVGMVFRMPMTVEVPDALSPWLEDITLSDETLTDLAQSLISETILTDRCGILVEQPVLSGEQTLAQKEASSTRPYLVLYKTESIINWEYARIGNRYVLKNVWLEENYTDADDLKIKKQVRQLTLALGFYQQIIWRNGDGQSEWYAYETLTPSKNRNPFFEIPFYPVTSAKATLNLSEPMIESLADINISHYKNSADRENGAHFAGLPLLWVACDGVDPKEVTINVGMQTALVLPSSNAKVEYAQVGSEGFSTLTELMGEKVQQMAALGARMLSPEKKQAEASQTHEIKRGGENAVLSSVCGTVERQLNRALRFAADWEGVAGDIAIELNRDFFPPAFTGADAVNWMKVWQGGGISKEALFNVLKFGEWLPDDITFEDMQGQIEAEGPALSLLTGSSVANDNGGQ